MIQPFIKKQEKQLQQFLDTLVQKSEIETLGVEKKKDKEHSREIRSCSFRFVSSKQPVLVQLITACGKKIKIPLTNPLRYDLDNRKIVVVGTNYDIFS